MTHDVFQIFDMTLRNGAQQEGTSLTVADKLTIVRHLDDFGVGFIEGGWPGTNPRDTQFFALARREIALQHAQLVAFGYPRRGGVRTEDDPQVSALAAAETPVVCIVAESQDQHAEYGSRSTPAEHLAMIWDTVVYLRALGRRVFVDCEHFFDGYRANASYAEQVVRTANTAGAEVVVLCDTNGGTLSTQIQSTVHAVQARTGARLGIHAQDDTGRAVANTLAAVDAGATHVRCTANGWGKPVGNADLFAVVAALQLKYGSQIFREGALEATTRASHAIAEVVGLAPLDHRPYGGASAHSADLYQHVAPNFVGNIARTQAPRADSRTSVELQAQEFGYDLADAPELTNRIIGRVKERELRGATYEFADTSLESLLRAEASDRKETWFELESWRVITEDGATPPQRSEATVRLHAKGKRHVATAEGHEPIEALGRAMRQAVEATFPEVSRFELVHYKVHALESWARVRVVVGLRDGQRAWQTTGVSDTMLDAFCAALHDALNYGLFCARREASEPDPAGSSPRLRNKDPMPHTQSADCTLTVALRHSRGALARLAVTLSSMPVSALSYAVSHSDQATAEVRVPQVHARRALARLNRMVDVLTVTDAQGSYS